MWSCCLSLAAALPWIAIARSPAQNTTPQLLRPSAVAYDGSGDLFIADAARNQIIEITLAGSYTIVGGDGVQGFSGDGGPATAAELNAPQGIAISSDGRLYIADTGNQRIRAVTNGKISTIAGSTAGFSGDGGPASAAQFNQPTALVMNNAGGLLICDHGNQRIRLLSDGIITTIAGNGIEGFAGDGAAAIAAELNQPSGIDVGSDGRVYIADTANQRVRVVGGDGTISTFAGNGIAGFGGDGGPATAAMLSRPDGLAIDGSGDLLICDQNNERLRRVTPEGLISTLAGSGIQGVPPDGTLAISAELNLPGTTAVSPFGWPLFSDPANHALRVLLDDGKLYEPGGSMTRNTVLSQTSPQAVYGTATINLSVNSSAGTPRGDVEVFDNTTQVGHGSLSQGAANVPLPTLSAGTHTLSGIYAGDGVHPSTAASSTITVSQAPASASAASVTVSYGTPIPTLSGTLTGVLPQDANQVGAVFVAVAPQMPGVGAYPISASLSGLASGNYQLTMAPGSGSITVVPADSVTTLSPVPNAYDGLPLQLTARVVSTTRGVPAGTVQFFDGATPIASAALVNGSASAIYLAPAIGSHTLTASYSGNSNFLSSVSADVVAAVGPMPDFGITISGASQQTVIGGSNATYTLSIASVGAPFTGIVSFSANGLPSGASASFSPPAVVPGDATAAVNMTILTAPSQAFLHRGGKDSLRLLTALLLLPLLSIRRRRLAGPLLCLVGLVGMLGLVGCGARTAPESVLPVNSFAVTVRATSTNLAGSVVVHSVNVTLGVE